MHVLEFFWLFRGLNRITKSIMGSNLTKMVILEMFWPYWKRNGDFGVKFEGGYFQKKERAFCCFISNQTAHCDDQMKKWLLPVLSIEFLFVIDKVLATPDGWWALSFITFENETTQSNRMKLQFCLWNVLSIAVFSLSSFPLCFAFM